MVFKLHRSLITEYKPTQFLSFRMILSLKSVTLAWSKIASSSSQIQQQGLTSFNVHHLLKVKKKDSLSIFHLLTIINGSTATVPNNARADEQCHARNGGREKQYAGRCTRGGVLEVSGLVFFLCFVLRV